MLARSTSTLGIRTYDPHPTKIGFSLPVEMTGLDPHVLWRAHTGTVMVLYSPGRTSTYPEDPPTQGLRFHYLGGGDEVGNVGIVLEDSDGTRLLLDYGIAPTSPPRYPSEAPVVHDAVITHFPTSIILAWRPGCAHITELGFTEPSSLHNSQT